jgi:putative heme-binding domain-containing protein
LADQVAVALGDQRVFPRMRAVLLDASLPLERRQQALTVLIEGRDPQAAPALIAALDQDELSSSAVRALSAHDDGTIPREIISRYARFSESVKRDAINTLSSRPPWARDLLDALADGRVPRRDVHAYNLRQLRQFDDPALQQRIGDVWGEVREASADKRARITSLSSQLTPEIVATADLSNGRRLFDKHCVSCHKLFGTGDNIGPDITGSNRANLDYILENIVAPSAVVGKDYQMSVIQLADGRIVQGLVVRETDSAVTVRTINDEVVLANADIEQQMISSLSLMPDGLLDTLTVEEVRDLIGYLGSPEQVPMRGPRAPIDPETGRVAGAIEGESLKILEKTGGTARSQKMQPFTKDAWSGDDHLWWTDARPGDKLSLELPVQEAGRYQVELVLTRASDYGVVQLALDDDKLGEPIDLYNAPPDVVTTGVLTFGPYELSSGPHGVTVEIVGANERAAPAYMFGLDYVRLTPSH